MMKSTCLYLRLVFLSLFVFSSCALKNTTTDSHVVGLQAFENTSKTNSFPGWFLSPSNEKEIGSIGIARKVSSEKRSLYFSRKYALEGLFSFFEKEVPCEKSDYLKVLNGEEKYLKVGDFKFFISDSFKTKDYTISRAACNFKTNIKKSAKESRDFLSTSISQKFSGVVGVSYKAVSPQRQYELAIENGLLLLRYSYGIDVKGVEVFERFKTGTGTIRFRKNKISLNVLGDKEKIRIYVKGIKYLGENLYVWLDSPDIPNLSFNNQWFNKNLKIGAIGISRKTASGLLSQQIEKAFKNGVSNLAKNDQVLIESIDLIEKSRRGDFFEQWVKSDFDSRVFPKLKGFHLDNKDRVHVWVISESQ